ncbi:MAG TPA: hypothetical protein VME43_15270 [Bryobacteraceae bacterium]|nr:hypothetical protein [Bryobacteraceae bacterium]
MPAYSGKFQYLDVGGAPLQQGAGEISFDSETFLVTPAAGAPLAFDLGDVDVVAPGEWELSLQLYTGRRMLLRQFGPAFGRLCEELLSAWRDRTVRCLLLEDLEEIGRFRGAVNGPAAEIRIYGSNLAVLPLGGPAVQWRLADLDSVAFHESTFTYHLLSGDRKLAIGKLAQKTGEFGETLRGAVDALRRRTAEGLHQMFPFLDAGPLQQLLVLAPEGRSVKLSALAAIHPSLPEALVARAVDQPLKPYFDSLRARAAADAVMAGFKFVRLDETAATPDAPADAEGADAGPPLFFWFFFPLAGRDIVAWESASRGGGATYFFRAGRPVEESIQRLTRGLAVVNFHREPVYLPDASLDQEARFHRYAIGRRKLPELNDLRAAFLGRAIHSSLEAWEQQVAQAAGVAS